MQNNKIVAVKYDKGESDLHMKAKDVISQICSKQNINLTNHLDETLFIEFSKIAKIQQEFSWYRKSVGKPIKSFSADVALLDSNNQIIAIIEVVKTNGLSEAKYNFYQAKNIFWLELAADHILTENSNFKSSFTYENLHTYPVNINIFLTESQVNEPKKYITKKQKKKQTKKQKKISVEQKKNTKLRKKQNKILKKSNFRTLVLYKSLNQLSNNLNSNTISINDLYQQVYQYGKFSNSCLSQLNKLGWYVEGNNFIKKK